MMPKASVSLENDYLCLSALDVPVCAPLQTKEESNAMRLRSGCI